MTNWKTTLAGIFTLAATLLNILHDPSQAASPGTVAGVATGVGLIVAKDAAKKDEKQGH